MSIDHLETIKKNALPGKVFVGGDCVPNLWSDAKYLYDLWNKKKAKNKAPQRKDFTPQEMKQCLALIALHDISYDPLRSKVRLIGTGVVEATGMEATGWYVDEVQGTEFLLQRAKWIVENCCPMLCVDLPLIWSHLDYKHYDVLALPLIDEADRVAMIMYLAKYY
ncbi:PAS domain-containing protein [Kordiimonas sp. SCSIO 12610]|uniref:PAS domain-containing protein n=1 Tax=Kordiimonas sp. SCSIO 12610 TaxID=2829597 RepID=UPI00210D2A60|nr:PAS domain-containing protein [Kordiimonas sp. SCSIO 12610]UTW56785.1 PAS domain-containing protein [Kordiimonas sp. SCSIO 12610]